MKIKKFIPITALLAFSSGVHAEAVQYMSGFLEGLTPNGQGLDLSYLQKGLSVPPGTYYLTLKLNDNVMFTQNVELREHDGKLEPVFKVADLLKLPLNDNTKAKLSELDKNSEIYPLNSFFEGADVLHDISTLTLNLSMPQLYMSKYRGDYDVAPKELWDYGVNGAIINYTITGNVNENKGGSSFRNSNLVGSFSGQLNIGAWRIFSSASYVANHSKSNGRSESDSDLDFGTVYAMRDLPALNSTMQVGQLHTDGTIFNSFPMLGLRLTTNESMLPTYDRYYNPIVSGTANTDAQIVIEANGDIIHTENVVAGPFVIDNLPTNIGNVDLNVTIYEDGGVVRKFTVANTSVPNMLKAGQTRYDFNVGQYYREHMGYGQKKLPFVMMTADYGLPIDVTLYGGALFADGYVSGALGTAFSLGDFGAIALDGVYSRVAEDEQRGLVDSDGVALRVRYEKSMFSTGTAVNIVNYRYTSRNFKDFNEVAEAVNIDSNESTSRPYNYGTLQSKWSFSVSQALGEFGSISASYSYDDYRDDAPDYKTYSVNYANSWRGIGFNLNFYKDYTRSNNEQWRSSNNVMFSFYIPFSVFLNDTKYSSWGNTNLSYYGSMNDNGIGDKTYNHNVSLSGSFDDTNISWSANQTLGSSETRNTSISLGYTNSKFNVDGSYSTSNFSNSYRAGIRGGLAIHSGGITAMNQSYDSIAIVEVGDVSGVKLQNSFSAETDWAGYGVLTNLNNYTKNEISIDPSTLPDGVTLTDNTQRVVYPTQGAIMKVEFPVNVGTHALFVLSAKGKPLPLGSQVSYIDSEGVARMSSLVGLNGRTYMSGIPYNGKLKVTIQDSLTESGSIDYIFNYSLSKNDESGSIPQVNLTAE